MEKGIDTDMGAKHAKWFVTSAKTTGWLRETELVPKTQGVVSAITEIGFAMQLFKRGKVPPPVPPHVAENVGDQMGRMLLGGFARRRKNALTRVSGPPDRKRGGRPADKRDAS